MKQIANYPKYFIGEDGKVFSTWKHSKNPLGEIKEIKSYNNTNKYKIVRLMSESKVGKMFSVHRLVADAYLPKNTNTKLQIDHIDNNKNNNHYTNLRWVTQKENLLKKYNEDGYKTHFAKPVIQISQDGKILNNFPSALDAAKIIGGDASAISKTCRGILNKTSGYIWKYV